MFRNNSNRVIFLLILLGAGVALPSTAHADGPLRSIVIFGNDKTETSTILDIIKVEPRTYVNKVLISEIDDRLVNSGFFKQVRVAMLNNKDGTADIRVTVTEKQLWFVFPTFQAWSGRYSGGAVFGESNLYVQGGSTLFLAEGGNKSARVFALFDAKNVYNSSFSMRTWVLGKTDDTPLYAGEVRTDQIQMKEAAIALIPGYQWTNDIRTSVQLNYRYVMYGQSPSVVLSGTNGHDVSVEFSFDFDSLRRREAFLKGVRLEASYEFAEQRFGSDYSYHIERVLWQQAFRLGDYFNYVYSGEGVIGDETLPFHRHLTLGGSSLRGYADRQFRGDTEILARQDLLFRLFRHKRFSVFGDVFHDLGLLYFEADTIGRSKLRNGVGGGLRVSLADILAPVFGLDFGYGIEDRAFRMYFALGLVRF